MYLLFPLLGERRKAQITNALAEWEARHNAKQRAKALAEHAARQMRLPDGTFFPSLHDGRARVNRKLSEPIVAILKGLLGAGALQKDLADAFGISRSNMCSIARNITWGRVLPASLDNLLTDGHQEPQITNFEQKAELERKESILRMKRGIKQSEAIRQELAALEQRRLVLEKLLSVLDDLEALEAQSRKNRKNEPQGSRSLRGAVLQVLSEADGPLKPKEIWERAHALGAASRAKNPVQVADLAAYQLKASGIPVEKSDLGWSGDPEVLKACLDALTSRSK